MTKKYTVLWSRTAEGDLESIINYISNDSPNTARKILKKIKNISSRLQSFPETGRIVPELKEFNIHQYRETIVTPWRIIYKTTDNEVYIMSVIDARRNVEDILLNRLIGESILVNV